ncbi:site-specific integrase [Aliiglaciecola litoralis]|uniref:Site-specific integrase n=1 Tax=Aliiglaciecola litoralis TaxID=582857 RepID=A0ABN1LIB9_9ALTE
MRVRQARVTGKNERIALIVDDDGLPIDRLNFFVMEELRGYADSTITLRAGVIIHIEKWATSRGISLEEEMATTCLSKDGLFNSLISHLHKKSTPKLADNIFQLNTEQVAVDYFNLRLAVCETYFEYLNNKFLSRIRLDNPSVRNNKILFEKLLKRLNKRKISGQHVSTNNGLTELQQASIFQALYVKGFLNWNEPTRIRNKLIILMLYETGIRKGELLSLIIENCHTKVDKPYISIKQNIRYSDPRKIIPVIKTLERVIPISKRLAELIDEYKIIRSKDEEAKKQPPFLFLSSKAPFLPLSISSFNNIFETIKKAIPDITKLSSHTLRHTRFENLDRYMFRHKYDDALKAKLKNSLGGWSRNSRTSENYEKLATEEQVFSVITGIQDEIDGDMYK